MRRRRKIWLMLVATPLVLLAADTVYWRIVVGNLEQGFVNWVKVQKANGWTAQTGAARAGGWPFAATLVIPAFSLTHEGPGMPGGVAWSAERVKLRITLAQPATLEISPEGQQQVLLAGNPPVPYTAGRLRLVLPLQASDWPEFIDLTLAGLRAETRAGIGNLRALQLHLTFHPAAHSGEPAVVAALHAFLAQTGVETATPAPTRTVRFRAETNFG